MGPYRSLGETHQNDALDDAAFRQRWGYTREAMRTADAHIEFTMSQPQHANCAVCIARLITQAEERGAGRARGEGSK